jgi:predicted N-acetyltransferase YhbS
VRIRPLAEADIEAARGLLRQLGYAISEVELRVRFARVLGAADHLAVVAEDGGSVVGLLHAFERPALEKPCEVVMQALVVDGQARGRGVGRALTQAAEDWARAKGSGSIVLHTQRAQAFYAPLGYGRVATTDFMRKSLAGGGGEP